MYNTLFTNWLLKLRAAGIKALANNDGAAYNKIQDEANQYQALRTWSETKLTSEEQYGLKLILIEKLK